MNGPSPKPDRKPGNAVAAHYASGDVEQRVEAALAASGLGEAGVPPEKLLALDQLHPRGAPGTDALAARAGLVPAARVLDLGGGVGGPARRIAATCDVDVTIVDLTEAYCRICARLSELVGLGHRVRAACGDVRSLPFADAAFDRIWCQYALMNVADRQAALGEAQRVLRPGGRLAMADVVSGDGRPLDFPVPWGDADTTHLCTEQEMSEAVSGAGFRILEWTDETRATLDWWEAVRARQAGRSAAPVLGPQVLFGADAGVRVANLMTNLADGRLREIAIVAERPDGQ